MQETYGPQPLPYTGTPQVIQTTNPGFNGASKQTNYNRKAAMGLGTTQMIIGIICLILNSVLIVLGPFLSVIGYGISGGILIFVAGLLQILSSKKAENMCLIIGAMVMTVIAAWVCLCIFIVSISEARSRVVQPGTSLHALELVMAVLASVEILIATVIVTLVLCCNDVCCTSSSMNYNNNLEIPIYVVGNRRVGLQTNQSGLALQSDQNPFPCQPSVPRVSTNPGLSNTSYS